MVLCSCRLLSLSKGPWHASISRNEPCRQLRALRALTVAAFAVCIQSVIRPAVSKLTLSLCQTVCAWLIANAQKKSSTELLFCQGRISSLIRGATLIHGKKIRALDGIQTYPRQLTYALTSQNTRPAPLTAPSAVHLTTRFLLGSQHPGLSVKAFFAFISASTV